MSSRHPRYKQMLWSLLFSASAVFLVGSAQNPSGNLLKYTIAAQGINASFIAYGARLTNLLVNDKNGMPQDIVLGYDDASLYINDTEHEHTYFGAVGELSVASVSWISPSRAREDEIPRTMRPTKVYEKKVGTNHNASGKICQPHEEWYLHDRRGHLTHYPE